MGLEDSVYLAKGRVLSRLKEEIRIARQIQQKLFPAAPLPVPGLDIAGGSFPAEATGGDYFDYIPMRDGDLAVVIGDVCGHGFGPALVMAQLRAYLRAFLLTRTDLGEVVGLSFVFAGILGAARRPDNGTGRILALVGFTFFAAALGEANAPLPYTIGAALNVLFIAAFVHLLVAYPTGTLATRFERRLVVSAYVLTIAYPVSYLLFARHAPPSTARAAECTPRRLPRSLPASPLPTCQLRPADPSAAPPCSR